jgi:hypothetical protein
LENLEHLATLTIRKPLPSILTVEALYCNG